MPALANWCSIAVVSPVLIYTSVVEYGIPYTFGSQILQRPAFAEGEVTDETAAMQKVVSRSTAFGNASEAQKRAGAGVKFFANKDVLKELPKVPSSWPSVFRGVSWLDQTGAYGISTLTEVGTTFDDLCMTYGGADVTFDPSTNTVTQRTSGLSWTWFNSAEAYHVVSLCRKLGCGYEIQYDANYSSAQIIPFAYLPVVGKVSTPKSVISFTMTTLYPKPGECPPKPGATKKEISKCATARRDSRWFSPKPPFVHSNVYYVFMISDEHHNPAQPYFDEYLKFAGTTSKPDPEAFQKEFGAPLPYTGRRKDVQMISTELPAHTP